MKCKKCSETAVIKLKSYGLALCARHLNEFVIDKTADTIRRYRMFADDETVVVAVSGGKDSLALWFILKKLGYKVHGLHLDLGISSGGYSAISLDKTLAFSNRYHLPLTVIRLEDELGITIDAHRQLGMRSACSTCGLVKRYLMNRFAVESGARAIATGHNLDDEAAVLLGNLLNWQTGYLGRQAPVLESWHPRLARKVKPFCERTERETAAFAFVNGIDYVQDECPHSEGASSLFYKSVLNRIEERSPGTKLRFYRGFLNNKKLFVEERESLVECELCGLPTVHSPCSYCRLKQRARELEKT